MKNNFFRKTAFLLSACCFCVLSAGRLAAQDTLTVMAYNVLNYGQHPLCQGPDSTYHGYLREIVAYANPDILGLEKMGSIKLDASDFHGTAPLGFGDSVLVHALNAAFPGKYAYCTYTNVSQADNMSVLFYNTQKLGFSGIVCSYANVTDFNTYKLYYRDTNLATTHDTTFLYVVLNHDQSGSSATVRNTQIAGEMQQLQARFTHLPNMIDMGDFNTRNSSEGCYQTLVNPQDTNYRFFDPPFFPDNNVSYPADWDSSPNNYTAFLTTSTRQSASIPNSCGTSGGAKSWYDHIFLSSWILHNANYIQYLSHSYRTLGNDGYRLSISINDNGANVNNAAPSDVIDALFQISNKYPVMVKLLVTPNTTGTSPADPQVPMSVASFSYADAVTVENPVTDRLQLGFPQELASKKMRLQCVDVTGRVQMSRELAPGNTVVQLDCNLLPGVYFLMISGTDGWMVRRTILKQ